MKIYTFYSDTHEVLYTDYFMKSFYEMKMNDFFEVDATRVRQRTMSGDFGTPGFAESMKDKVEIILRAIDENKGSQFIFADCDIQFLQHLRYDLANYNMDNIDMLAQSDQGAICAGFMMCKSSPKLENFFNKILHNCMNFANDQLCINEYRSDINYELLPEDKYYTVGNYTGLWNGEDIDTPKNIVMHHANFTVGVNNKIKLLNLVKNKLNTLQTNDNSIQH